MGAFVLRAGGGRATVGGCSRDHKTADHFPGRSAPTCSSSEPCVVYELARHTALFVKYSLRPGERKGSRAAQRYAACLSVFRSFYILADEIADRPWDHKSTHTQWSDFF